MYGEGSRGRGYVCMYVRGGRESRKRSNGSGTGRRERGRRSDTREKGAFDDSANSFCRRPATGSEGREQREESWGPVRRTEGRAASLPLVPGQIYSDCHVIVPVRWQCVRLDCVCLVDIVEACWEAVNEV